MREKNIFLKAYSEAFILVIPYVLLMAIAVLLFSILDVFELWGSSHIKMAAKSSVKTLSDFFSFVLLIAISYQLAKRKNINPLVVILTSVAVFVCTESLVHYSLGIDVILSTNSAILTLIIPLLVILLLPLFTKHKHYYLSVNWELNSTINYTHPVIIVFTLITFVLCTLEIGFFHFFSNLNIKLNIPDEILFYIRTISNHILWFFGLHGGNFFDSIVDSSYLDNPKFDGISYKQFYDIFVIFGGAGAGLSLLLALFLASKDKQSRRIAKLATPFVIFNINEILIFGIPIIFNKFFFIPFITVPVTNLLLASTILMIYPIEFTKDIAIPWLTPALVNVFIATDGNLFALGLQIFLIALGTLIYYPFIKKYSQLQSYSFQHDSLINKLDIKTHLESKQELRAYKAKIDIIESNKEIDKFINILNSASLLVYYQPKVDIKTNSCNQYEALLRIKINDVVKGPYFLPCIEEAGLAPIIDLWVCHQVNEDLKAWKESNFNPKISINLHPDTLADERAILQVRNLFLGKNVDFEIIERGLLDGESPIKNIRLLKESGFSISIDDFGTGFSSFEILCMLPIDSLKIDKSLIDLILTPKGYIACDHIIKLSQDLGINCVAEGVESFDQFDLISKLKVHYIQGYIYSPAIPFEKVREYSLNKIITSAYTRKK